MHPVTIFYPVLGLVLLTAIVWITMLMWRGAVMRAGNFGPQDVPTRVLADQRFGSAQMPNNNLMNLFEMPVLFYVSSVCIYVLMLVDNLYVGLGWAYVALRAAHSLIALTYNNVLHRGLPYLASGVVLWVIWSRIAWDLVHIAGS